MHRFCPRKEVARLEICAAAGIASSSRRRVLIQRIEFPRDEHKNAVAALVDGSARKATPDLEKIDTREAAEKHEREVQYFKRH